MSNTQVGQLGRLAIRLCAKLRPCSGRSTALSFRWLVKGTGRAENRDARRMEQDLSCDFRKMTVDRRKRGSHVHRSFVAGWSSLVARQAHNLKMPTKRMAPSRKRVTGNDVKCPELFSSSPKICRNFGALIGFPQSFVLFRRRLRMTAANSSSIRRTFSSASASRRSNSSVGSEPASLSPFGRTT